MAVIGTIGISDIIDNQLNPAVLLHGNFRNARVLFVSLIIFQGDADFPGIQRRAFFFCAGIDPRW
ncbi:hypothetical protein D3C73_1278290 [compost metagenome]